jgi:hypothetical protein
MIVPGDAIYRLSPGNIAFFVVQHRMPEDSAANGKTADPFGLSADVESVVHPLLILASAENNNPNMVPAPEAGPSGHGPRRLGLLHPFHLPDVGFNPGVLQFRNCLHHEVRTELQVIGVAIPLYGL